MKPIAVAHAPLAQRGLVKIPARVAAHPARTELTRVRQLADAAWVFAMDAAVMALHAALDAFLVMPSESARLHGLTHRVALKIIARVTLHFNIRLDIRGETFCEAGII